MAAMSRADASVGASWAGATRDAAIARATSIRVFINARGCWIVASDCYAVAVLWARCWWFRRDSFGKDDVVGATGVVGQRGCDLIDHRNRRDHDHTQVR